MEFCLFLVKVLLTGVFAVAGVSKVLRPVDFRDTLVQFGLPFNISIPLSLIFPVAELIIAASLLLPSTAWWGSLFAFGLLLILMVTIVINLGLGRRPDCNCFGQLRSKPIGWQILAIDVALASAAGFLVWKAPQHTGSSALAWMSDLTVGQILGLSFGAMATIVMTAQSWFLFHLFHQHGRLLLRADVFEVALAKRNLLVPGLSKNLPEAGLPIGVLAPAFELPDLDGAQVTLKSLRAAGHPVMLVFTAPSCSPCIALASELGRWHKQYENTMTLVAVSRDTVKLNRIKFDNTAVPVLLQQDQEVAALYLAYGTPSAVMIQPNGTIGSELAKGADAIRQLIARAVGVPKPSFALRPELPTADPQSSDHVPVLNLPALDGQTVQLADFLGRRVVILFWNPDCGFCKRMLPDLQRWEADLPANAPELLVVSAGIGEANRAMGLRSRVVLDPEFRAGSAFGVRSTPSAVLIGRDGKLASTVSVGASNVLVLLGIKHGAAA